MTESNKSISPLRQRMIEDITMRKKNPKLRVGIWNGSNGQFAGVA